jgi:NitT/TauT family transport system ATP-binding protein
MANQPNQLDPQEASLASVETPAVEMPAGESATGADISDLSATLPAAQQVVTRKQASHIVELKNVTRSFGDPGSAERFYALQGLSFHIPQDEAGAFVVLLGPSGCGKSTILSLISGLALPDEGVVEVFGMKITGPDSRSATVQQSYTCFPWLSVLQNVEFGLALRGKSRKERRQIAEEYLYKVGLGDRLHARPRQLSGGMQQRVAIARTLAVKPKIVLMDEPFGALDAQTRSEMQQMLLRLWKIEKNTIVFVTHDIAEAVLLADRIIVFSPRPARIIHQEHKLDEKYGYERPPTLMRKPEFIDLCDYLRSLLKSAGADVAEERKSSGDIATGESGPGD